jgi:putative heme-binding domain-containing protein
MNGVMKVVENVDAYLAANPLPEAVPVFQVRPFVREWGHAELGELLQGLEKGRSYAKGREIFAAASCTACHRVNGDGTAVGPSLEDLAKEWAAQKVTDTDLLWELVEPSKTIKEKFRSQVFVTVDGRQLAGLIVDEDKSKVRLLSNPLMVREPETINVDQIEERFTSPVSLMPKGLLNTLTAEEILDLLAYLKAGGDPNAGIYKP